MICRQTSFLLLACPFYSLNTEIVVKNRKSPVADIRKMLLMKDRGFLYELRAYLIYAKVGENVGLYSNIPSGYMCGSQKDILHSLCSYRKN